MSIMRISMLVSMLIVAFYAQAENHQHDADGQGEQHQQQMQHQHQKGMQKHGGMMQDDRVSLGLPEGMKQHQLANMRAHLDAVRNIVGLIAEQKYEQASTIAHQQLGMTNRMQKMCDKIGNEEFKALGQAFHQSGDMLGEVLLTRNAEDSLRALNATMSFCVQCHATFRQ